MRADVTPRMITLSVTFTHPSPPRPFCLCQVFGITFRTPPEDSTGVPHILEHSVLCGSRKFPVKEPFVDMVHRPHHPHA